MLLWWDKVHNSFEPNHTFPCAPSYSYNVSLLCRPIVYGTGNVALCYMGTSTHHNMFCVCEKLDNVVVDQLRIDCFEDFRMKANQILAEVNHPTYFDENTNMLMILWENFDEISKETEFWRADITVFYKGIWCQNCLHFSEDSFVIKTQENQMLFVPVTYHMFIMKIKQN